MTRHQACAASPTRLARRLHVGPRGEFIPIIAGPNGMPQAYPPAYAAAALANTDEKRAMPLSRPAHVAEFAGWEDWEPQGLAPPLPPPTPLCTNCMAEGPDVKMNRACASCGVQGCERCIRGSHRECDDCLVANGHGTMR